MSYADHMANTTRRYKSGDTREDGKRFWSYCNGKEIWRDPESWQDGYNKKIAHAKARQDAMRKALDEYKVKHGCVDCGYNANPWGLEFDHRPGTKKLFSVGTVGSRCDKLIWDEVAKCEVVCGTCHCIRTMSRRSADRAAKENVSA
jgi:hypothetical protein